MAYSYEWIDNATVINYKGVKVYRVYNDDNHNDPFSWHFGLSTDETEEGETVFDIRELPNVVGRLKELGSFKEEEEMIVSILREAIDLGLIKALAK